MLYMVVVKGKQIRDRNVPVLIPGEKQPVHNIRMPVTFRYVGSTKDNYVADCLHGKLGQPGRPFFFFKKQIAFCDDVIEFAG